MLKCVLFVVAVSAAIFGAPGCGANEATFKPEGPRWQHAPLTVESLLDDAYLPSVKAAITFWNRELGMPVLVLISPAPGEVADVLIGTGSAGAGHLGVTWFHSSGRVLTATIELRQPGDVCQVARVLEHELGHVLGLAHDAAAPSIMARYVDGDCFDIPYLVTDRDLQALEGHYRRLQ